VAASRSASDSSIPITCPHPTRHFRGTAGRPAVGAVYSATVPLAAGKTVASVTLPTNFDMRIFAIAAG
jgi:hypothetical protein